MLSLTEAELEQRFPAIPWRESLPICTTAGESGLACRLCVAMYGLHARDVSRLPQTREEFDAHLALMHPGCDSEPV